VTIRDDDPPPTVGVADVGQPEGPAGTRVMAFTVSLSGPSGYPVSVRFATADGTARAGADYLATAGLLTFAPGETSKTVRVAAVGDAAAEADETFSLTLSAPGHAVLGRAVGIGTILNDD
jgi:chitinase